MRQAHLLFHEKPEFHQLEKKRICQKESDPFFFCSEEMPFNFTFYDWRLNFLAKLFVTIMTQWMSILHDQREADC